MENLGVWFTFLVIIGVPIGAWALFLHDDGPQIRRDWQKNREDADRRRQDYLARREQQRRGEPVMPLETTSYSPEAFQAMCDRLDREEGIDPETGGLIDDLDELELDDLTDDEWDEYLDHPARVRDRVRSRDRRS